MIEEPKAFTFQAYLKWLNNLEPKTEFTLWKAMMLAKYAIAHKPEEVME